jgi:formylglycine-generating enzyme required for sulfatase activity
MHLQGFEPHIQAAEPAGAAEGISKELQIAVRGATMYSFTRVKLLVAIYLFMQTSISLAQISPESTGAGIAQAIQGSPRKMSLPALSVRASSTPGTAADTQVGYATIAKTSGSAIYGTSVLSYAPAGVVISEVGVPPSPPTRSARVFIDYRSGPPYAVDTGLAIANTGATAANITYTLRDLSAGVIQQRTGSLAAGAHSAKFISNFGDLAPGFVLPGDFSVNTKFGSLEISSDQPISIIALRMTTNQNNEVRFTTTPIADLSQTPGSGLMYFPQLADGGGYTTTVILLNTSSSPESGSLRIMDNNGNPLAITPQDGGVARSEFRYEQVPPGGGYVLRTNGSPAGAVTGWVLVTPDWGTYAPAGAGIFSFSQKGVLVSEAGVPSSSPVTHARLYIDTSKGHNTGLAIANPAGSTVNVAFNAFWADGRTAAGSGPGTRLLKPNGHDAAFADQLISGLPTEFKGEVDISSPSPVAILALRSLSNSRGEFLFTTFPIPDVDRTPVMPIVFPQIADGGGYTTEMILLSTAGDSSVTVDLFGDSGISLQTPVSLTIAAGPYGIQFVTIPSGRFQMGTSTNADSEKPVHTVVISHFFELGKFEVSQAEWKAVLGANPSYFTGDDSHPVEEVSWNDVQKFIGQLNLLSDGYVYRLPTEAEWEYACRAGMPGDYVGTLWDIAWYSIDLAHPLDHTYPVGTKLPNVWGLHDTYGNVMEWVQDYYDNTYYSVSPTIDPPGSSTSTSNPPKRSIRGGSYGNHTDGNRSTARHNATPDTRTQILGFRIMRAKS